MMSNMDWKVDWDATRAAARQVLTALTAAGCAEQARREDAVATVMPFISRVRAEMVISAKRVCRGPEVAPSSEEEDAATACVNKAIAGFYEYARTVPGMRGQLELMGERGVTCTVGEMEQLRAGKLDDDDVRGRSGWYMQGVEVINAVHENLVQQVDRELARSSCDVN
jgi:hypothetical protein